VPALWMVTAVELWFRAAFGAYNARREGTNDAR